MDDPDIRIEDNQYDNEFIKYIAKLAENKSLEDIVDYINDNEWTDRQKNTIMIYTRVILGNGLGATFIQDRSDYQSLYDDKALVDCDLPLGMTVFDLTPEFNILMGLINMHFGVESRKSVGGFMVKRIGTTRQELLNIEENREKEGFGDKLKRLV